MNIETVRSVATATERNGPQRTQSQTRLSAYAEASASARVTTGPAAEKRITAVEKSNATTASDSSSAVSRVPDSAAVSRPAEVLGKLREIADSDPEAFSSLLNQGASEIKDAIEIKTIQDPERMLRIAESFQAAARAHNASNLDPSKLSGSPATDQLATALLARANAVLGLAPAPYGPWFPR